MFVLSDTVYEVFAVKIEIPFKMNQGQMDQGQMDEGQMDQGQMDQCQMDQGQMDQCQMDQGQMSNVNISIKIYWETSYVCPL